MKQKIEFCATNFPTTKSIIKKAFIPRNSSNTHNFPTDDRKQKYFSKERMRGKMTAAGCVLWF